MVFLCTQVGVLSREEESKGNHIFLRAPGFGAFYFACPVVGREGGKRDYGKG